MHFLTLITLKNLLTLPTIVAKIRTPNIKSIVTKINSTVKTGPGTSPSVVSCKVDQ